MIEIDLIADMVKRRAEIFAGVDNYAKCSLIDTARIFEFTKATLDDALKNPAFILNGFPEVRPDGKHRDEDGLFCLPFDQFVVVITDKVPFILSIEDVTEIAEFGEDYAQTICAHAIYYQHNKWRTQLPYTISLKKGFEGIYTSLQCSNAKFDDVYNQMAEQFKFVGRDSNPEDMPNVDQFIDGLVGPVASAIYAITSQAEVMFRPAAQNPPTLNQVAKAKKPLWEYRLVKLDSVRQIPGAPRGGHHESPRWHMVRGHWRNLKSGKTIFIRAHEKGDKSKGIIEKDYERKAA